MFHTYVEVHIRVEPRAPTGRAVKAEGHRLPPRQRATSPLWPGEAAFSTPHFLLRHDRPSIGTQRTADMMHDDQIDLGTDVARALILARFPQNRGQPIERLAGPGTVTAGLRIGSQHRESGGEGKRGA